MLDWRSAALRGEVAEWRDRQRLAAAAAVNAIAVGASEALERRLVKRTRVDPLADLLEEARPELDALIRQRCQEHVGALLNAAARELRGIDARGEAVALQLLREGWPPLPEERQASAPKPAEPLAAEPEPVNDAWSAARDFGRRLASLDRALVTEGARAGARATAVLGDMVRDLTGYQDRVRAKGRTHIEAWLFVGTSDRAAVLPHLEAAIDAAAAAARKEIA